MKYTVEQLENANYDNVTGVSIDKYYYNIEYTYDDGIRLTDIVNGVLFHTDMSFDDLVKHDLVFYEYKEIDLTK